MPNLTDIPSNVAVGFVTTQGSDYYYGDLEVRKYLQDAPSGVNIYCDSNGVLHFDRGGAPTPPAQLTKQRVVLDPASVGINSTEPATMTILT